MSTINIGSLETGIRFSFEDSPLTGNLTMEIMIPDSFSITEMEIQNIGTALAGTDYVTSRLTNTPTVAATSYHKLTEI